MAEGWVFTHHMMFFSVPGFGSLVGYKYVTPSGFGVGSLVVCLQKCHPFGGWVGSLVGYKYVTPFGVGLVRRYLLANCKPLGVCL